MKHWEKIGVLCVAIALLCPVFAGCTGVRTDEEQSPELVNASITSYNEGSEAEQYVQVELEFDREIQIKEEKDDSLRITIGGERIQNEEYDIEPGDNEQKAVLLISVDAVTSGVLKIEKSEKSDTITDILDETGKYAVKDFELEGVIPSGVTLSDVASDETSVTKQVDSVWNIRSIAWVSLTKDGEVVPVNESDTNEELDGRVAVHGHEFLIEDEAEIAQKMAEALNRVYSGEYEFEYNGNQVTAKAVNGEAASYDIVVYQCLKINGQDMELEQTEQKETVQEEQEESEHGESEHEAGLKSKVPELNREIRKEEQEFLDKLHISAISEEQIKDGTDIYKTVTIIGDAMPEEAVYSVRDLEQLIQYSFENQGMNELELPVQETVRMDGLGEVTFYGLDFTKFIALCGVDVSLEQLYMSVEKTDGSAQNVNLSELLKADADVWMVFATQDGPLQPDNEYVQGMVGLVYTGDTVTEIGSISRLTISKEEDGEDPCYRFHNREPFSKDQGREFTIEVYKKGAEYLGAINQKTFTTAEFEQLMAENPRHIVRNYYGTIGNAESYIYMGTGGWLDFFEGLDLSWLLTEQMGVEPSSGSVEFYGRDGEMYAQIDDLGYLFGAGNSEDYYVLSADGVRIPNAVPMIACTKNGYPILPEHDHESSAYIAYNYLNLQLEANGLSTEIGVVKNHNGPYVACLGNLDGYYGGNEMETGGDCVLMKIYLE